MASECKSFLGAACGAMAKAIQLFHLGCSGGKPLNISEQQSDVIRAAPAEYGSRQVVLNGVGVELRVGEWVREFLKAQKTFRRHFH